MRRMLVSRRPGILLVLTAPGLALLLAGCGSDSADKGASDRPVTATTSASATVSPSAPQATPDEVSSPPGDGLPTGPAPDASSQVDEAFRAARIVALQSNLAHIDPELGTPEDIEKADAQCADLKRNVSDPDQVAARRFSTDNHKVTEADGKRINTLLRNTYCG